MKPLKYIFFLALTFFIGASIYVATLDGNYDVKQTRTMKVPVDVVFNNVNDYKNWEYWGPWFELDSTMVASYPEITSGVGASYTWTGKEGLGSLKTISLIPNKKIIQEIDFGSGSKPEVYWELKKLKNSTEVTWGIRGENTFGEKIYWLINGGIEKNMTPMYQRGLELLAQQLQKEMDAHSTDYKGIVDHGGGFYLYQTVACKNEIAPKKMTEMFPVIVNYMVDNQIEPSGKPFTLNHEIDIENNTVLFSTCIPVKERIITESTILTGYLAPQKTFKIIFKGNYKFLPEYWPTFYKTLNDQGYTEVKKGFSFEIYTINPSDSANPANWLTEIYIPIL
jgi:effector-binding domain-containing protein